MDFRWTEPQMALQKRIRSFAKEKIVPLADEADASFDTSWEVINNLKIEGLFRYVVPEEYGGHGFSSMNLCIIRNELSRVSIFADEAFVQQGLASYPVSRFGNPEQKEKYLPPLATGDKLISFCLTEPDAGSDVAGIRSTAIRDGDRYILNGRKCYVSKPDDADLFLVFSKTDPAKHGKGISAFVMERGISRFDTERERLVFACPIGDLILDDTRVPTTNRIGEEGRGMSIALSNLNIFRPTVGAAALGMAEAAFELAMEHAQRRAMFGKHLIDFQVTQSKLAEMRTEMEAAKLLLYQAAWMADQGEGRNIMEASMAKYYATEMAHRVVDQSVQIHGGIGINQKNRLELLYRAARAPRIYEGTTEIQKIVISRALLRERGSA